MRTAAVVLAAGRSSRMGAHKLLLPLGGRPLVTYALAAAEASDAGRVVVVLGHEAERARAALPAGRHMVAVNSDYASGLASSVATGLRALGAADADAPGIPDAVVFLLGDQPLLSAAHVNAVLDALAAGPDVPEGAIAVARYAGRRGNPVAFGRRFFAELLAGTGDEGGRPILARHPEAARFVDLEPPEAALDADRPEDYARIVAAYAALHGENAV